MVGHDRPESVVTIGQNTHKMTFATEPWRTLRVPILPVIGTLGEKPVEQKIQSDWNSSSSAIYSRLLAKNGVWKAFPIPYKIFESPLAVVPAVAAWKSENTI